MNTDYAQLLRLLSESKFSAACVLAHAIERSTSRDLEAARIALNKAIDGKELDWPKVLRRTTQTDAEWADSIKAWQIECNRRSVQFEILQSRLPISAHKVTGLGQDHEPEIFRVAKPLVYLFQHV